MAQDLSTKTIFNRHAVLSQVQKLKYIKSALTSTGSRGIVEQHPRETWRWMTSVYHVVYDELGSVDMKIGYHGNVFNVPRPLWESLHFLCPLPKLKWWCTCWWIHFVCHPPWGPKHLLWTMFVIFTWFSSFGHIICHWYCALNASQFCPHVSRSPHRSSIWSFPIYKSLSCSLSSIHRTKSRYISFLSVAEITNLISQPHLSGAIYFNNPGGHIKILCTTEKWVKHSM